MQNLQIFEYNGFAIEFQVIDGELFANATGMCQAFNKRPNDWLNLPATQRYIDGITRKSGNAHNELVRTIRGGLNPGTWIHEKLILKLAQWLDVDFEIQCDEWVSTLLRNGETKILASSKNNSELMTNDQIVASALKIVYGELQETRQQLEEATKNIEKAAPKLAYVDKVLSTEEVIATTVIASEFGMSAIRMNKILGSLGIQRKVSDIWVLTTPYLGRGYTKMVTHLSEDREGRPHVNELMYWTQRGRAFIHWKLNNHGYNPLNESEQLSA